MAILRKTSCVLGAAILTMALGAAESTPGQTSRSVADQAPNSATGASSAVPQDQDRTPEATLEIHSSQLEGNLEFKGFDDLDRFMFEGEGRIGGSQFDLEVGLKAPEQQRLEPLATGLFFVQHDDHLVAIASAEETSLVVYALDPREAATATVNFANLDAADLIAAVAPVMAAMGGDPPPGSFQECLQGAIAACSGESGICSLSWTGEPASCKFTCRDAQGNCPNTGDN